MYLSNQNVLRVRKCQPTKKSSYTMERLNVLMISVKTKYKQIQIYIQHEWYLAYSFLYLPVQRQELIFIYDSAPWRKGNCSWQLEHRCVLYGQALKEIRVTQRFQTVLKGLIKLGQLETVPLPMSYTVPANDMAYYRAYCAPNTTYTVLYSKSY